MNLDFGLFFHNICNLAHSLTEQEVTAHISEIPENGADSQHPNSTHVKSELVKMGGRLTGWLGKWNWHEWGLKWAAQQEDNRNRVALAHFSLAQTFLLIFTLS